VVKSVGAGEGWECWCASECSVYRALSSRPARGCAQHLHTAQQLGKHMVGDKLSAPSPAVLRAARSACGSTRLYG
jgi:hypothetical protein